MNSLFASSKYISNEGPDFSTFLLELQQFLQR